MQTAMHSPLSLLYHLLPSKLTSKNYAATYAIVNSGLLFHTIGSRDIIAGHPTSYRALFFSVNQHAKYLCQICSIQKL